MYPQRYNPPGAPAPAGPTANMVRVPPGSELFISAGLVARDEDGRTPAGAGAQWRVLMTRIAQMLAADGMDARHLLKVTWHHCADIPLDDLIGGWMELHGDHLPPPATAVRVPALSNPDYLVEVEFMAARLPA